ncbi:hypothetical protein AVEN_200670-1 [Araneus ventricosus]|uniref:Reverse transcriptase RNase H-like domain-containing protein n=1 Tax=Araneus ventricosus TaxID=182803 RepID=A0A4Y2L688_ARAVE|nr:hypothetical protein AVEN_200670-1 [Araneus ventricosus]
MRSKKQTERQLLLMESSLAYPRGKEGKSKNSKGRQNEKGDQTLGYLGVVMPVTPKEDVPLTGSSDRSMGAVLSQIGVEGNEHPNVYLSKKFSGVKKNYGVSEKECAAIIYAIQKLRHYLDGQPFTIETDHNPLVWLKSAASKNPGLMR